MSDTKITPADLEAILKLVESAEHLGDFHLKYGDLELRVSRHPPPAEPRPAGALPAAPPATDAPPPRVEETPPSRKTVAQVPPGMAAVKAPMVGTFYRAPSPGASPFVEVGDRVQPDTVVCIIEVMKLMNTIHAETAGIVREIRVENSQPIEFGQVLLVIEPQT
ncbi:MAG TPA: acetyl-CoA carboxylase biotin carboxyl carrier protein [Casimicrobiaceae bacterium]|nr:acetyl-CoA carboxylase biotin carboxyl carrier protein [Casimicrobiaceae bacterium]